MNLIGKMIKGRGKISSVGEGIHPRTNAPAWTPVQFEDGTFAVLDTIGDPIVFENKGEPDYNEHIRDAASMPRVSTLATGRSHICIDVEDGRKLTIRVGWGFGKEDEPPMHRWEDQNENV